MNYKVSTYLPKEDLQVLIEALQEMTVNSIGYYKNCITWYPVRSTWTSLDHSDPYIGAPGEVSVEDEIKVEWLCAKDKVSKVIEAIRQVHPYEEPVIDIIPMYTAKDWEAIT